MEPNYVYTNLSAPAAIAESTENYSGGPRGGLENGGASTCMCEVCSTTVFSKEDIALLCSPTSLQQGSYANGHLVTVILCGLARSQPAELMAVGQEERC